ncbi:DUF5615 family PIN-like protein [Nocardia higoensis]|uniref:DUF5615 family PIN-like protein n=1 Tax=Nocardia higoensis TaxID=228599 RepID=UPI0003090D7D
MTRTFVLVIIRLTPARIPHARHVRPEGNRTTDDQVTAVADAEDRVVVSKDADFRI